MSKKAKVNRLNEQQLGYYKDLILKKRSETLKEVKRLEEVISGDESSGLQHEATYSYHMADVGTDSHEKEKAFLWLSRAKKYLGHLNTAIDRVKTGEYGVCIECGKFIPKERLEEVAHTQHCAKCKSK